MTANSHSIDAYDYELPPELVAQEPLPERASSRLLVVDRSSDELRHRTFGELPDLLSPGDLLVTNRSRVFPAFSPLDEPPDPLLHGFWNAAA